MVQKKSILMLAVMIVLSVTQDGHADPEIPVTEEQLQKCYVDHPFFFDSIIMLSDDDYANSSLAAKRKTAIKNSFLDNRESVRECRENFVRFATAQDDPQNLKYVIHRLKEVTEIIYSNSESAKPGQKLR